MGVVRDGCRPLARAGLKSYREKLDTALAAKLDVLFKILHMLAVHFVNAVLRLATVDLAVIRHGIFIERKVLIKRRRSLSVKD